MGPKIFAPALCSVRFSPSAFRRLYVRCECDGRHGLLWFPLVSISPNLWSPLQPLGLVPTSPLSSFPSPYNLMASFAQFCPVGRYVQAGQALGLHCLRMKSLLFRAWRCSRKKR